jgi:raffinose/stachyose/melibiose transport system permease protein
MKCFIFAFLAPSLVFFTLMFTIPILQTLYISLMKWDGIRPGKFIGVENYRNLFTKDRNFYQVLRNSLVAPVVCNIIQIPAASVLAYMVYRTRRGLHFFQTVYFVPVVLSSTLIGMMFLLFFNGEVGPLNSLLKDIGVANPPNWLSDKNIVLYTVLAPAVWQYIGYFFVIILAGMQSISDDIVESATIDGANTVTLFFRIVLPLVKKMIHICIILNTIGALKSFDLSFIMSSGGPGVSSTFLAVYMYKQSVMSNNYGLGSAVAAVLLVLALLLTIMLNWVFSFSENEETSSD